MFIKDMVLNMMHKLIHLKLNRKRDLFRNSNILVLYNNPDKTKETRIKNGTQIDDNDVESSLYKIYKRLVINRTLTFIITIAKINKF